MKTKNKILLTICITLIVVFCSYLFLVYINNNNLKNIINIEKEIHKNTLFTVTNLHSENLAKIVKDYGCYDEMIDFMKTRDTTWAKSDITIVSSYEMDAVWVYNIKKETLYSEFSNLISFKPKIPKESLNKLFEKKTIHFFLKIPQGIIEISGGSINNTKDTKRLDYAKGYILIGKLWNNNFIKILEGQTNSKLGITTITNTLNINNDPNKISIPLYSFDNKIIASLISKKENLFLNNNKNFITKLFLLFGIFSILILFIVYFSFKKYVINPLDNIITSLKSKDDSILYKLKDKPDEFGNIAEIIIQFFQQKIQLENDLFERKIIELNLRESEKRFRDFAELLPGLVCEAEINGKLTFANKAAFEVFGWKPNELENLSIYSIFAPEDIDKVKENLIRRINGEIIDSSEYLAIKKDGTTFPALVYVNIIFKDGKPESLRGIMVDITAINNAQKEIRKLLQAIEQSPNTIVITDIYGNIEYVNPHFTFLTGYTEKDAIGKNPSILKSGKMTDSIYKTLWETIKSGNTWKGEFINKKKNGEFYWELATISPVKDKAGNIINFIAVKEDITERKKLEQKLIDNNEEIIAQNDELKTQKEEIIIQSEKLEKANVELEKLSVIARETSNTIAIFDSKGKPEWVNEAFTRMYGYTLEEFITIKGDNLFEMSSIKEIKDKTIKVLTEKQTVTYNCQISTKFNSILWIQTTLSPIIDKNGNVSKFIAIDSDITKLKNAEEEIRQQKEEIEATNDELELQRNIATMQRDEIYEINNEIRSSIRYAENIQKAILPPRILLESLFEDYFVIYLPKDIVSGDFYWVKHIGNKTIVTVADCTGHGVPGAFMSILGVAFLNEIVNKKDIFLANEILNELREHIVQSLHQIGISGSSQDGMDMAIVIIDETEKSLQYAGANNQCWVINENSIKELCPDKMPVGIHEKMVPFKNNVITIQKSDQIYLFTDGLADQFGGPNYEAGGKKFKLKQLKELLISISSLSMNVQKDCIEEAFQNWRNDIEQTDDITIMGIKI